MLSRHFAEWSLESNLQVQRPLLLTHGNYADSKEEMFRVAPYRYG